MVLAYDRQLLMLPFDHRSSFSKDLLGLTGQLNALQIAKVRKLKHLVYKGFLQAAGKQSAWYAILVDDEFGADILADAKQKGYTVAMPVERSGQQEFNFDSESWRERILKVKPDIVKVLVRYNPGNKNLNKLQLEKLMQLSAFCKTHHFPLLFELLVPPMENQKTTNFDSKVRPKLVVQAIKEIERFVDVTIWKIEGLSHPQWKAVIAASRHKPTQAAFVVLGRNANEKEVDQWIRAANYPEVVGFAVGRTTFYKPLELYIKGKISEQKAIDRIAKSFQHFVATWSKK